MNLQLLYSHSATFYHSTLYQIISQSLDKSYTVHKYTSIANSICVIFDDRSTKEGSVSYKFIKQRLLDSSSYFKKLKERTSVPQLTKKGSLVPLQDVQRKELCPTSPQKGSVLPLPITSLETSHLILRGQQDMVLSVSIQKPQTSMFSAIQQRIYCEPDPLQNLA